MSLPIFFILYMHLFIIFSSVGDNSKTDVQDVSSGVKITFTQQKKPDKKYAYSRLISFIRLYFGLVGLKKYKTSSFAKSLLLSIGVQSEKYISVERLTVDIVFAHRRQFKTY